MEPIINPWIFYFMSVVNTFRLAAVCVCCLGGCFAIASAILHSIDDDISMIKTIKIMSVISTICLLISLFVPSKQTMIEMIIASNATPNNINMVIETIIENAAIVAEVF